MRDEPQRIVWHPGRATAEDRARLLRQQGCVVWLTGLSGSGKSTIARAVEEQLLEAGHPCYVLDGDNIRHGLNADLGFSPEDRAENIRRIGQVAALFADAGLITFVAFISPYRAGRQQARSAVEAGRFIEVFLDASLPVCEQRDPKGFYRKARAGEVADFTGISAPYERPEDPELTLPTDQLRVDECARRVLEYLRDHGLIDPLARIIHEGPVNNPG
jgi:adenylylsulfate kinase